VEAAHVPWRPLGELFVGRGLITEDELETALVEQAATGKRLGEILVDRGLVSGPDLTSALMDQLGVEISKEEGYGSGLWAEIKRRHKRAHREGDAEDEHEAHTLPEVAVLYAVDPEADEVERPSEVLAEPEPGASVDHADEVESEPDPETESEPEPVLLPPAAVADPELEHELDAIRAEYSPPSRIDFAAATPAQEAEPTALDQETEPEPWPLRDPTAFSEPTFEASGFAESTSTEFDLAEPGHVPEPAPIVAAAPDPGPQPGPAPAAPGLLPERSLPAGAEEDDRETLRAELEQARTDVAHLREMLEDSMVALAALTAERDGTQYAE
jgi:hypothetical protein